MKRFWITTLLAALICAAGYVCAQTPVDIVQTWSEAGIADWTNDLSQTALSNPGGYLNMQFPSQTIPAFQADTMRMSLAVSNVMLTNISFKLMASDFIPSAARVCVHSSRSGNVWYLPLSISSTGQWITFDIPLDLSLASWFMAPVNSADQFRKDMVTIDWCGVYVIRRGDMQVQNYAIDDFRVQGVTVPHSISILGTVAYNGEQENEGVIHVLATSAFCNGTTIMSSLGNYQIGGLDIATDYAVSAYRDSNGNNTQDLWESCGSWTGNPAKAYLSDLSGINITMTDPISGDGLPYWWLYKYFGVTEPGGEGGGGGLSFADVDSDGDNADNYEEYKAGTDPTNFLSRLGLQIVQIEKGGGVRAIVIRWPSVAERSYAVWRSENLMKGFSKIDFGIAATPSFNEYEDTTATNHVPYYYKVQVE